MSYKTVDVLVNDEHKVTMSGTDEQINIFSRTCEKVYGGRCINGMD